MRPVFCWFVLKELENLQPSISLYLSQKIMCLQEWPASHLSYFSWMLLDEGSLKNTSYYHCKILSWKSPGSSVWLYQNFIVLITVTEVCNDGSPQLEGGRSRTTPQRWDSRLWSSSSRVWWWTHCFLNSWEISPFLKKPWHPSLAGKYIQVHIDRGGWSL